MAANAAGIVLQLAAEALESVKQAQCVLHFDVVPSHFAKGWCDHSNSAAGQRLLELLE